MDLSAKDAGGALDITNILFSSRIKSASSFEFWNETGTRYTVAGDTDIVAANILHNTEIFGITGSAGASPDCSTIGTFGTWVLVPGDPDYGTNDFCVMKFEAKNNSNSPASEVAGSPWTAIDQFDAITECASLGKGYHLITNDEWMTIAANAANEPSNWSGDSVGSGTLYRGHSDNDPAINCGADSNDLNAYVESNCTGQPIGGTEDSEATERRTHTLSNGSVIWDLAGNIREWVNYFNDEEKPSPLDGDWREYSLPVVGTSTLPLSDLIPTNAIKSFWVDTWDSETQLGLITQVQMLPEVH